MASSFQVAGKFLIQKTAIVIVVEVKGFTVIYLHRITSISGKLKLDPVYSLQQKCRPENLVFGNI